MDEAYLLKTTEEKYGYVSFLRPLLSNYEISVLFYNGLSSRGVEKFKPLIEKYALFNNIDDKLLVDAGDKVKYAPSAYLFQYKMRLEEKSKQFEMCYAGNGTYNWKLEISVQALYGDFYLSPVCLENKDCFTGDYCHPKNSIELYRYVVGVKPMRVKVTDEDLM